MYTMKLEEENRRAASPRRGAERAGLTKSVHNLKKSTLSPNLLASTRHPWVVVFYHAFLKLARFFFDGMPYLMLAAVFNARVRRLECHFTERGGRSPQLLNQT